MLSRRTRILLAVLVVASLTFVILDLRGGQGPFSSVRSVASNVLGGLERVATTVFSPITGAGSWWSDMRDQAAKIDTLETENGRLRSELDTLTSDKARADALDALLRVSERRRLPVRPRRGDRGRSRPGLLVDDHHRRRTQRRHRGGHVGHQR